MNDTPPGWARAPVSVLVALNPKTDAPDDTPSGFTPMQMLGTSYCGQSSYEPRAWGKIKKAYTHFRDGDVLLAKVTPCFENGKSGIASGLPSGIGAGSSEFYVFRPNEGVDCRYLLAYLSTADFRRRATMAMTGAVGLRRVPRDFILSEELLVAPFAEQQRIADKLDSILTKVDAVNTRLTRVAPILKRFRQSVLTAVTSGRLTEQWRTSRGVKAGKETTLQSVCLPDRVITYGVVKLGDETKGGTPCLRTSNVRWLRFELDVVKHIQPSLSAEYGRTVLRGAEVLVNVRGTLGGVAVATDKMVGWNVSREVAVVPVDKAHAAPAYISFWIASDECQRWLTGKTKGVAYTGINIEDLRTLPLTLPSKVEQFEIVRRVERLFAFADRLEARLKSAQAATECVTPALLAKAFRGELVPQDPNDEPATELLRRLQAGVLANKSARTRRGAA